MRRNASPAGIGLALILIMAGQAIGVPVYFPVTGNYYDHVSTNLNWPQAEVYASSLEYEDTEGNLYIGHLTTLTSAEEETFLENFFEGYLGFSDKYLE